MIDKILFKITNMNCEEFRSQTQRIKTSSVTSCIILIICIFKMVPGSLFASALPIVFVFAVEFEFVFLF